MPTKKPETKPEETKPDADVGQDEVQKRVDEAEDKGFIGVETDPTPNREYSVQAEGAKNEAAKPGK